MSPLISKKILLAGLAVLALLGAGLAAAAMQANPGAGASPGPRAFHLQDGVVSGRNVGFSVDANGDLLGYTSHGPWGDAVIFESIRFATSRGNVSETTRGPAYVERDSPDFSLVAFDARNAALLITSAQGNVVTFRVPAGVDVRTFDAQPGWSPAGALLTSGNHTAKLTLHGNATVAYDGAGTITVTLGPHGSGTFRITGFPGELLKERKLVERAAARPEAKR